MKLKIIGKVFTSKFVGTGPSSYKQRIHRAAVSQRLRNAALDRTSGWNKPSDLGPTTLLSIGTGGFSGWGLEATTQLHLKPR